METKAAMRNILNSKEEATDPNMIKHPEARAITLKRTQGALIQ